MLSAIESVQRTDAICDCQLTADNVLLRLLNPERMSHGLWIPDGAQREAYELWRGEVVKVGPGARTKSGARIPVALSPGDMVGFYWLAGRTNVTAWPDDQHRIIPESQIQVVYEG